MQAHEYKASNKSSTFYAKISSCLFDTRRDKNICFSTQWMNISVHNVFFSIVNLLQMWNKNYSYLTLYDGNNRLSPSYSHYSLNKPLLLDLRENQSSLLIQQSM